MDFVVELLLTAVVALLFSFLVAKLVSLLTGGPDSSHSESESVKEEEIIMEEFQCTQHESKVEGFQSQNRVAFVVQEEPVEQITVDARGDEIVTESDRLLDHDDDEVVGDGAIENFPEELKAIVEKIGEENVYTKNEEAALEKESGVESPDDGVAEEAEEEEAVIEQDIETKLIGKIKEIAVDEDDDDWEGIERSELEKTFAAAAKFVNTDEIFDLASVDGDVQMELYALHKVATEGPCRESQPMALMMSARAKCDGQHCFRCARNAWQRLGNMSPEVAMERYIFILSEKVPRWMEEHSAGRSKQEPSEAGMSTSKDPALSTLAVQDPPFANEHTLEMKPNSEGGEVTSGSNVENQVKEDEHSS